MKKSTILIMTTMILLGWIANVYAAEILGYPIVEKQARFYTFILGIIGVSVGLVGFSSLCLWLVDLSRNTLKPARRIEEKAFPGELAGAAQSAK